MLAATDRLAESIDAAFASIDKFGASFDAAGAEVTAAAESIAEAEAAAAEGARAATEAIAGLTEAEKAAADEARLEAEILADLDRSQALLADSAKAVTDGLAAEAKAMGLVADEAALAGDATAAAGDKSVVAGDKAAASGEKAAAFGGAWKTALLGVGLAAVYGIDKAGEFQSSMEQLHTQAGVAQSKIAGLSQGVLQLAGQVGEGPQSLSESLYHVASNMASMGATGPQMMNAVKIAAQGAQVGGANLVDVTNALTAAIASGIPGVQNYSQAMGMLNAAVGSGDMHMQDLADAFSTGLLATVKGYGITLKDTSAALATLGDNNIRGAKAGTDFRMAVQALAVPVATAKTQLSALGLTQTSLADDMKSGGLMKALDDLSGRFQKTGITAKDEGEVITTLFGKKAGSGIAVLLEQMDRLKSKYPAIQEGADKFAGDWQSRTQTVAQQFDNLKSGAQALAISFGTLLLPAATKVIGVLAKFANVLEEHPALAAFAGALLAVAVAFKVVATAEAIFDAVTDANPVMLVVMAVIALAAGLYVLYTHFKIVRDVVADVGKAFSEYWDWAMKNAEAVIKWFVSGPLAFIKQQLAVFSQFWAQHGAQVEQITTGVWNTVAAIVTTAWNIVMAVLRPGLVMLEAVWKLAWGIISDTVRLVWDTVAATIRAAVKIVTDVISLALDLITGKWGAAWNDCKKLVSDTFNGILNIFSTFASGAVKLLWDAGVNIVDGLINGIKSMIGAVGSAISSVASGAVSAFKSALSIFSPSRVFYQLGAYITQGLANGISETAAQAEQAAASLADKVNAAYRRKQITAAEQTELLGQISSHLSTRADTLYKTMQRIGLEMGRQLLTSIAGATSASTAKTAVNKLMSYIDQAWSVGDVSFNRATQLLNWVQGDNEKLQSLAAKRQSIVATIKAADAYAANVTSSTESWASLSNAQTESGGTSGADIGQGMKMQLAQIREFANDIKTLAKRGLSKTLLDQIIQAGPASGLPIAESLMDDTGSQIKSLNASQSAIAAYSDQLGAIAGNAMYDSGSQAGKGFLSGLSAQESAITKEMDKIANSMVATLKKDLKISSPSRVMHDAGSDTAAGLVQGLTGGRGGVQQAAHGLAQAITAGVNGGTSLAGLRVTGSGSGTAGGNTVIQVPITVQGFIGNQQELAQELFTLIQHAALQNARRNPTNGLSLIS